MRVSVWLQSRGTAHPICHPSLIIATRQLWLFHETIMSPLIVFPSNPTCFAGTNTIAIDLITVKNRFFSALATSNNPPFILVVIKWLPNELSIPGAPEKYVTWEYSLFFLNLEVIKAYYCDNLGSSGYCNKILFYRRQRGMFMVHRHLKSPTRHGCTAHSEMLYLRV